MMRSINKLSSAARLPAHPHSASIRYAASSIPPRAGESSKSRYLHASALTSIPSIGPSRQPETVHHRDLHSTSYNSAQPHPSDDFDEYDYGTPVDWDDIPLDAPTHTRSHGQIIDDLEGIDFSSIQIQDSDIPHHEFENHDDQPPSFDDSSDYDPTIKQKRKRRRRVTPNLPPLPEGELPPDGSSRFDWRETSLSSGFGLGRKKEGDLWYPHLARIKRVDAVKGKLEVGELFRDEVDRYENHFKPLLQAEYEEEEKILMQRLEHWSMDRLTKDGYMLNDLGASILPKQPKNVEGVVWTFNKVGKQDNKDLPFHKFDAGAYVFLSRTDPCIDPVLESGAVQESPAGEGAGSKEADLQPSEWMRVKVYSRGNKFIRLIVPQAIENLERGHWRLDLGMSDWAYQQQLLAIKALNHDSIMQDMQDVQNIPTTRPIPKASAEGEDAEIDAILAGMDRARDKQLQTILNGTSTRDLLLRAFQTDYQTPESSVHLVAPPASASLPLLTDLKPTDIDATPVPTPHVSSAGQGILARDQLIHSWAKRYRGPKALRIEGDPIINLNPSQLRAMAMMLSERISLVQGPPGTGKTRVIVEVIKLLKQHLKIPFPIMVCAHTNVAVDNLLAPLRRQGIKALRGGSSDRVREDLKEYTLDQVEQEHPLYPKIEKLRGDLKRLTEEIATPGEKNYRQLFEDKDVLRRRIYGLQRLIDREVLLSGDVICTTLLSAASRRLQQIDYPMVFIDEASMATEPLTLIPLMKGSSHVAIIGDHKQLPPVIISPVAHGGGLATSLFERLIHEKHIPSVMLDTQYRMHPDISSFPNRAFYASALKDGPPLDGTNFEPPRTSFLVPGSNVTFLDHDHPETPESSSLANYGDATIVCNVIADLLYHNPNLRGDQIGIIAPYTAQVRLILKHLLDDVPRQEAFSDILGLERVLELQNIEVKTVDGFQGREKDVMIVSMVRSNPGGWVGFLGDWRRLNVALTRARRALFIIGSATTLSKARFGAAAAEQLPKGGTKVLRDHIRHLKKAGLIMPGDLE